MVAETHKHAVQNWDIEAWGFWSHDKKWYCIHSPRFHNACTAVTPRSFTIGGRNARSWGAWPLLGVGQNPRNAWIYADQYMRELKRARILGPNQREAD